MSTTTVVDELIVCSVQRWPYEDMLAGAGGRFPVRHDRGFDVPEIAPGASVAWWIPAEHAARLLRAGLTMHLSAPGPTWLAEVPEPLSGRAIWVGTVAELGRAPRRGWAKPAEAKVDDLPARWYDDTADFASAARAACLPDNAWVQVSPTHLELAEEHRCYVQAGVIRTTSPYLLADGSTWEPGFDGRADLHHADARAFAQACVNELGEDQPDAYTLDVGLLASGAWVVVEANPAWCSGTYGCDLAEAVDTVVASSTTRLAGACGSSPHGRWAWKPDPHLVAVAERKPPLSRPPSRAATHRCNALFNDLHLRPVRRDDEAAFRAAQQALAGEGFPFAGGVDPNDWNGVVVRLQDEALGINLVDGRVPQTFLLAVVGEDLVGRISIRHRLNEHLRRDGGHIGYAVLPAHRRRGYATEMLRQGLHIARSLGIERALLTCNDANVASIAVIERCGGELEWTGEVDGRVIRRYWIDTGGVQ